jgi:hypothetical protein
MAKVSSDTGDWIIFDTSRNPANSAGLYLYADASNAEATRSGSGTEGLDILSNGFKIRDTTTNLNWSTRTYIYMAFAENPFQNSLAR